MTCNDDLVSVVTPGIRVQDQLHIQDLTLQTLPSCLHISFFLAGYLVSIVVALLLLHLQIAVKPYI